MQYQQFAYGSTAQELWSAASVVVKQLKPVNDLSNQQVANAVAERLLHRFGLGHRECEDGIVLVYSVDSQAVSVAAKSAAKKYLTSSVINQVATSMREEFAETSDVGAALIRGIDAINAELPTGLKKWYDYWPEALMILVALAVIGFIALQIGAVAMAQKLAAHYAAPSDLASSSATGQNE
eukprot:GDKI01029663.1.p3 GENE.GDKI01029663.1~~GDKI01029663.1.p3  ORF type:complete len:181 (+),score=34.08 GDKI01029663.1:516-1058(+)